MPVTKTTKQPSLTAAQKANKAALDVAEYAPLAIWGAKAKKPQARAELAPLLDTQDPGWSIANFKFRVCPQVALRGSADGELHSQYGEVGDLTFANLKHAALTRSGAVFSSPVMFRLALSLLSAMNIANATKVTTSLMVRAARSVLLKIAREAKQTGADEDPDVPVALFVSPFDATLIEDGDGGKGKDTGKDTGKDNDKSKGKSGGANCSVLFSVITKQNNAGVVLSKLDNSHITESAKRAAKATGTATAPAESRRRTLKEAAEKAEAEGTATPIPEGSDDDGNDDDEASLAAFRAGFLEKRAREEAAAAVGSHVKKARSEAGEVGAMQVQERGSVCVSGGSGQVQGGDTKGPPRPSLVIPDFNKAGKGGGVLNLHLPKKAGTQDSPISVGGGSCGAGLSGSGTDLPRCPKKTPERRELDLAQTRVRAAQATGRELADRAVLALNSMVTDLASFKAEHVRLLTEIWNRRMFLLHLENRVKELAQQASRTQAALSSSDSRRAWS